MKDSLLKPALIISAALGISAVIVFSARPGVIPARAQTAGEISYGGMRVFTEVCTCSGNLLEFILDYKTNSLLTLVYQPGGSRLFQNNNPYGAYLLGSYMPGAGVCSLYVGTSCIQQQSTGMMGNIPGTGTSL